MPEPVLTSSATVCIIGFGDSGAMVGAALAQRGHAVRAWDLLLDDPARCEMMRSRITSALVDPATSLTDAVSGAKVVVCAVGASAATVKREVTALLVAGQELLDVESLGLAYDPAMRQTSIRGELP
jgi:3-hydroxyisobutyrate dehydrogenase-like beta-hydroxyacid dehydrogenase